MHQQDLYSKNIVVDHKSWLDSVFFLLSYCHSEVKYKFFSFDMDICLFICFVLFVGNLFIENAEQKMNLRQNQQTLELLREMMSSKDIMNDSLSRTVVSHLAEIEDLRTSRQHLQQILRIVQVERTQLQEEKNVLKMDLDIVEGQNETLRAEKIRLDLNCNKLKTRNRELEEKAEVEAKLLDEIVENINRNLAIVEGRLCEAENNLRKMVRENGQLKQILTTVTEDKCRLEQDNSRLEQDNSRLIDVYNRLEQTLTNVNEDKCRLEEGYNRLEQDNSRLAQTLTTVTEDKFRLEQDNSRLEQTLITVTDDKCRLEQTLTTVTEDKCRLEQTLTTVTEDKCRLEQTLTSVTKDNNRLEQVNSRLEDGYSRLEQTLTTVTDDKCRLEQDKSRLEQTLTTVTEDNNRLEQDNSRLEQDNSRLEQDNSRLEQGYIKLEQNNSKLELNQKSLQRQLFALKGLFIILILGFMLAVFNGSSHNLSGSLS